MNVRFWGVRGSIACPGANTLQYGGNTPCVEIQITCDGDFKEHQTSICPGVERLIFDGGTGLRVLGQSVLAEMPLEAHLFFTHTHWDHIQGFPFFTPAFVSGNRFQIYGAIRPTGQTIRQCLSEQMLHPNFPVPLKQMAANLQFHDLEIGKPVVIKDITVENAALNHPGGSVGYRVNWQGLSVSYITDTEHYADALDPNVLQLAQNVDVLIYDATYTDEEYHAAQSPKVGWGHSTWQEAVKVATVANAKQLILFHHDPAHSDAFLDQVGVQVRDAFANSLVAREGLVIELCPQPGPDIAAEAETTAVGEQMP